MKAKEFETKKHLRHKLWIKMSEIVKFSRIYKLLSYIGHQS